MTFSSSRTFPGQALGQDVQGIGSERDRGRVGRFSPNFSKKCSISAGMSARRSQRRDAEVYHVQTIKESSRNCPSSMSCRRLRFVAAMTRTFTTEPDRSEPTFAARPSRGTGEEALHPQGHFTDFVEEYRAVVRHLELARLVTICAGETSFDVSEQLGFEQRFRQTGAVHGDEVLILAWASEWIARATTSLPTPLSPVISTFASERATRWTSRRNSSISGLMPINSGRSPTLVRMLIRTLNEIISKNVSRAGGAFFERKEDRPDFKWQASRALCASRAAPADSNLPVERIAAEGRAHGRRASNFETLCGDENASPQTQIQQLYTARSMGRRATIGVPPPRVETASVQGHCGSSSSYSDA